MLVFGVSVNPATHGLHELIAEKRKLSKSIEFEQSSFCTITSIVVMFTMNKVNARQVEAFEEDIDFHHFNTHLNLNYINIITFVFKNML